MPIFLTAGRSANAQINGLRLRHLGTTRRTPSAPVYINAGSVAASNVALNVVWPADQRFNDMGILVIESSGDDATATVSGWAHVAGSPVVDIGDATGSKLHVLWKIASSDAEPAAAVPDLGDHAVARILVFRGVRQDIAPGGASATDAKIIASTSVTWPAITTPYPNSLILCIASRPDDSGTAAFSGFTNANLTGVTELADFGTTSGNGGGVVVNMGVRGQIGDIGTSSGTSTNSVTNAVITFALEPDLAFPA